MNRILVIRGGAIGDFVLTLPALKLLRMAYPAARLEVLGYKHIAALAHARFYADAVQSLEAGPLARFFANDAELPEEWAEYFSGFDLVISYLFDPDQIFARNLQRCGVETLITASPKVREGNGHAAAQLAEPLRALDLALATPAATLHPSAADQEWARQFMPEPRRALHPGSGSASKTWPLRHWLALLGQRPLADSPLLVVGGEADREQLNALRSLRHPDIRFAENLPLPHLAALLQRSRCFVGHDSGISHIAAAVGTPCLLLFGATDPFTWAPQNDGVRVVRSVSRQIGDLAPAEVRAALDALTS